MSIAAPAPARTTTATSPPPAESPLGSRLPAILRTEPVSRHTRIVLYVIVGLMVLGEILTLVLGPTVAAGLSADPELAGILEEDGGLTGEGREPLLRWVLFLASVLVTLLFGWQPTLAAVFVLLGSTFGLVGLVEADHAHLTPQAFSGGVVLGAAMVTRYSHRVFVWFALGALILLTVAGEVLTDGSWADEDSLKGVMVITLIVALCVAVPAFMIRRSRHRARDREAALRRAEEAAACAAEAERQRIAAELHDVVAHGLTVISMQAAMLPTQKDPEKRAAAEKAIEQAARQSLVDLRRMLTALRGSSRNAQTAEGDAVVDLPARLDEFEARLHAAGFAVERSLTELDELPRSLELTVLRVVQESVTNILKHAPRRGTVRLTSELEGADRLVLCIASPMDEGEPRRDRVVVAMASGFGLAGMRERVAVFGGTLMAGPLGGCWVVRAEMPLR